MTWANTSKTFLCLLNYHNLESIVRDKSEPIEVSCSIDISIRRLVLEWFHSSTLDSSQLNTSSSFSVIIFHPAQERRLNYRAHGERHPSTSWLNGIMNQVPKHFCRWWRQRIKSRQRRVKINTRVNWAGARLWQFIVPAKLERSVEILDFTLTFNEQWSGQALMLRNRQWIVASIIEWHLWLQSAPENELLWIKKFFHETIAHAIRCLSLAVNRLINHYYDWAHSF